MLLSRSLLLFLKSVQISCDSLSHWTDLSILFFQCVYPVVCGGPYQAVSGFRCHRSHWSFYWLHHLHWSRSPNVLVVDDKHHLCGSHDCSGRISVHEIRNESHTFDGATCGFIETIEDIHAKHYPDKRQINAMHHPDSTVRCERIVNLNIWDSMVKWSITDVNLKKGEDDLCICGERILTLCWKSFGEHLNCAVKISVCLLLLSSRSIPCDLMSASSRIMCGVLNYQSGT